MISSEPFPAEGLPLEQARSQVLAAIQPLNAPETLGLDRALGRVAAGVVRAREAVPGFRAAIMDGYAIGGDSAPPAPGAHWQLVGRSAPGLPFQAALGQGQAVRILTGAPVPEGSGRVLPQELVRVEGDRLRLERPAGPNAWIRSPEEEAAPGQVLLEPGHRLGPAQLGRLASCGVADLKVWGQPRIGLLISGDELTPLGEARAPGAIWESNGLLLEALLQRLGYATAERLVVADQPPALRSALQQLAQCCDLVVTTGGVSAGDADWIRPLVAELGEVGFWKLFLRPGRPFAFGHLQAGGRRVPFFGLPGNPVAAAVTALQLLWPALQRLEGAPVQLLPRLKVRLATGLKRAPGRPELARARLEVGPGGELLARVEGSQASSRIGSLEQADLLLEIPAEQGALEPGLELWAQLLRLPLL
ncbi:MAG: molybdopterin molybdotransferase MoeA [Cyanobacteriota bacterium]|nr:molybdopterin molybdotransferase MoeA [Cyanobacteriota bacterium]